MLLASRRGHKRGISGGRAAAALRLVTDRVQAADALFAALVCRATRDLMYLRFERRGAGEKDARLRGKRFATPDSAVVCSVKHLPLGCSNRAPGGAEVGQSQRLRVG
eukprot:SAG22_NODE_2993_length_2043_cov_5.008230_1_plen_107_part_00